MLSLRQAASTPAFLLFAGKRPKPEPASAKDLRGKRVDVYYNLHEGRLSLRGLGHPDRADRGRVIGYADSVLIENAEFVVQQGGRRRVLKEKRKNVHAFVRGIVRALNGAIRLHPQGVEAVTYNPYKYDSFVKAGSEIPVTTADQVLIEGKKIHARGLKERTSPVKKASGQ